MAREFAFIDGFDCYTSWQSRWDESWGSYSDGNFQHNEASIISTGGRQNSGRAHVDKPTGGLRRSRFNLNAYWTVGVACKPSLANTGMHVLTFLNGSRPHLAVRVNLDGTVDVVTFRNGNWVYSYYIGYEEYTVIGSSSGPVFTANAWNYLEVQVFFDGSTGYVEVRANGSATPVIDVTGVSTIYSRSSSSYLAVPDPEVNGLVLGCYKNFDPSVGTTCTLDFDDLYVDIGSDGAFRGDCRVFTLLPTGAGNYSEWTPSAGSNYQCVDEATPNDDTDYVSEGTANKRDTYVHDPLPTMPDGATIHVVAVSPCAKKESPGVAEIAAMVRSGTTDALGATVSPVAGTYLYYPAMFETDPDTASAWTVSGVDDMEFGQKVIT